MAFAIVVIVISITYASIYNLRKDYDNKFQNVVDQVNDSQSKEFKYDILKNKKLDDIKSQIVAFKKEYVTKDELAKKIKTDQLEIDEILIKDTNNWVQIDRGIKLDSLKVNQNTNTNNLLANNSQIKNVNVSDNLNIMKNANVNSIEGPNQYGVGQLQDGSLRVYDPKSISLSLTREDNTFDDVLSLNFNGVNTNRPIKIKHNFKNELDKAGISVYAAYNEIGGAFGGPDQWSYLPYSDGNTYIRPGKRGGDVILDQAVNINLKSPVVNISSNLCVGNKCVNQNNFNTMSQQVNIKQLCLDNSCIDSKIVSDYDSNDPEIQSLKLEVQKLQSQLAQLQTRYDTPLKSIYQTTESVNLSQVQQNVGLYNLYKILGIGTDQKLYTKAGLNDPWIFAGENTCCVIGITQLKDGSILGIGTDKGLWLKKTLTDNWVQIPNSGFVISVCQLNNDVILGIGLDNKFWSRSTINANWVFEGENTCCVINFKQLNDGRLLGIGLDNTLWLKNTIKDNWTGPVQNSCCVKSIMQTPDNIFYGVGLDNKLYYKNNLTSVWQLVPNNNCCVTAITLLK